MSVEPGRQIAHFRVAEKIGAGGMGEVYRAVDTKLRRSIALKVLPATLAGDPARLARFEREARAVAALNHPNIVTIHSVEEAEGTLLLIMELVEGVSLDRFLPPGGLPLSRVFDVGIALADALGAAHEKGIIHRDLKPANVMIAAGDRVKVLDFGLARLAEAPPSDEAATRSALPSTRLTREGIVMGTVPYMSPEQLRGTKVDHRTDIFSLGVVLYELATGRRPFRGNDQAEMISSILRDAPPPVAALREDAPRHLGRIIAHCLEKDPDARFQTAKDIRNELRSLRQEVESGVSATSAAEGAPPAAAGAARSRWMLPAVAGAAATALIAVVVLMSRAGAPTPPGDTALVPATAREVDVRRSVAVLGFKNMAAREYKAWLSTAFSELLATELAAGGTLRTIPGEAIARMKAGLDLAVADSYSADTLSRIRGQLGSQFVVAGTYLTLGDAPAGPLRLDLRLQDTEAGETVASLSETGTEADLLDLVTRRGERLRRELGAAATTAAERAALGATLPASPGASRAYHEGLELLRNLDALAARQRLENAAEIEPDHPMIRWALAEAWSQLGYRAETIAQAERAFQSSGALPQRQRQEVEGRYREVQGDWERAIAVYRSVWDKVPDDLDAGLRLASVQTAGGKGEDALGTLASLRALPGGLGEDPRIALAESQALFYLGRYEPAYKAASRALERSRARGAPLLEAAALMARSDALNWLGRNLEALPIAEAALGIYRTRGHPAQQAGQLLGVGNILDRLGRSEESNARYLEALTIHQATGNRTGEAAALNNLANNYGVLGELGRAKEMYEMALAIEREIKVPAGEQGITLSNLGLVLYQLGEIRQSAAAFEESLSLFQEAGNHSLEGWVLNVHADHDLVRGEVGRAEEEARRSLELAGESGALWNRGLALLTAGRTRWHRDRPGEALRSVEDARDLLGEMPLPRSIADLTLAAQEIEAGSPERAVALARQAREGFSSLGARWGSIRATALLARALSGSGRREEADRELRAASTEASEIQSVWGRLDNALDLAYAERSLGRPEDARRRLEEQQPLATELGAVLWQMEAGILAATLDARTGDAETVRAALKGIEKDARTRGLLWLARKASAATAS